MANIKPLSYKLEINPELSSFSFSAAIEILLEASTPTKEVILNAIELAVWNCRLFSGDEWVSCPFSQKPEEEHLIIELPEKISGEIKIRVKYEGKINNSMAGFYRSKYVEGGEDKYIAVTQFQESDARRVFPCLDYPAAKAVFDIEMVVDDRLTAVSNEVVIAEKRVENGKKRVKFRKTPKMSTYLVFLGVGDFEMIRDDKDPRVAVITPPNQTQYGVYGVKFGRKALNYCEEYYGIDYPLPKMDLIAVPDFAFGAMENWGAVTFRENLLLYYPNTTSRSGEQRICEVIAHEIVHQWFGNLVTPSDWKYLWLNESFATYFAYRIVDSHYPEWDIWGLFLNSETNNAMNRDQLRGTTKIEIPEGEHVVINSSTAPIIYSKGGSILRQVEGFIGAGSFRKGLNHYLALHAYDNAESDDLWKSFEEVSDKPVTAMMKNWIGQPGYPLVTVQRSDSTLTVSQKRFTCLEEEYDQTWLIPLSVRIFDRDGGSRQVEILMDNKNARIDLGENDYAYKINHEQTGFYRVKYEDEKNLKALGKLIHRNTLGAIDRWGVQNDLYNLLKAGGYSLNGYLEYLKHYRQEEAFLPLTGIASNLEHAYTVYDDNIRNRVRDYGKDFFGKALQRLDFEPRAEENAARSMVRDQVLWKASLFGDKNAKNFTMEKFSMLKSGMEVHADIISAVLRSAALYDGQSAVSWMQNRFKNSSSEHERMNILSAMACFDHPDLISKTLEFTLKEVPSRNKFVPIAAMAANIHSHSILWDWIVKNISELEKMHPLHFERVIAGVVPSACIENASAASEFLTRYIQDRKQLKDAVDLALEKLEINRRMRFAKI